MLAITFVHHSLHSSGGPLQWTPWTDDGEWKTEREYNRFEPAVDFHHIAAISICSMDIYYIYGHHTDVGPSTPNLVFSDFRSRRVLFEGKKSWDALKARKK